MGTKPGSVRCMQLLNFKKNWKIAASIIFIIVLFVWFIGQSKTKTTEIEPTKTGNFVTTAPVAQNSTIPFTFDKPVNILWNVSKINGLVSEVPAYTIKKNGY